MSQDETGILNFEKSSVLIFTQGNVKYVLSLLFDEHVVGSVLGRFASV